MNVAVKQQQQAVFQSLLDKNSATSTDMQQPCAGGTVAVSATGLAVKQEPQPVIGSTPPVLPAVTPSLVPVPVTYAAGMLQQPAVGTLQLTGHSVNADAGYMTRTVPLNQSVIQFLQQQQQQQSVLQSGSGAGGVQNMELTGNSVSDMLAAAAAPKTVLTGDNVNVQMLMNLINQGQNKAAGIGTVQWAPAPAHCSSALPGSQVHSPFIVQKFNSVAAVPHDLSSQLVFSLNGSTSFASSFAAPSVVSYGSTPAVVSYGSTPAVVSYGSTPAVVSYGSTPAVVSSVLVAAPATTAPHLAHSASADDQVLNLTLHSSNQRMDTNALGSYPGSLSASQANSFPHVEPSAFVASASKQTSGFSDMTAVTVATTTYAQPMAVAAHYPTESEPPPLKTMICMTNTGADAVNQVLVQQHVTDMQQENNLTEKLYVNPVETTLPAAVAQPTQFAAIVAQSAIAVNDPHSFAGSNVIVHMDTTSSPHPPAKPVQTSTPERPHEMNAAGIISGNLEPSSLFLSDNNPMLAETSSQAEQQSAVDLQGFTSQSVLGMDISSGQLAALNVPAEPAALNVTSSPTDDSSANSMSSNLQQSLAELLDLQQQINAVNTPASQSVQPSSVLDSPLGREIAPVATESMQWVPSTTSHVQSAAATVPAASNVVLASASVGTINLLTAAEVLSNTGFGQEANHDVFYPTQQATSYAMVIGSAGNSQETSAASNWNHQAVQSSYASLATNENTHKEIKQEQLSGTGDVVLDLLTTMSTAAGRPEEPQLYTQQTTTEVAADFFNNSDATLPATSSSVLTGTTSTDPAQSVIYVINPVAVDSSSAAQEQGSQPITYHIVTANQLPDCNQSQDIGIVRYAASQQVQPAAAQSDVHSPTATDFRVLAADALPSTSTEPPSAGIQFQLSQPLSFGSKPCCLCSLITFHVLGTPYYQLAITLMSNSDTVAYHSCLSQVHPGSFL